MPTLAVLAAALAVGTAAPAQASVLPSRGVVAATDNSSAPTATRHRLSVPPDIPAAVAKSHVAGPLIYGATSTNWSGYVAAGRVDSSVSAAWVQPTVNYTNNGMAAFWVGLDGAVSGDYAVEQIGTTADCTGAQEKYYAWYELFPAAPANFTDTVAPGDDMSASVTYTGGGYHDMVLADYTGGWREDHSYYDPGQANTSAEIIAEAPSEGGILPLPDFGSVGFCGASINGNTLATAGAFPMTARHGGQHEPEHRRRAQRRLQRRVPGQHRHALDPEPGHRRRQLGTRNAHRHQPRDRAMMTTHATDRGR